MNLIPRRKKTNNGFVIFFDRWIKLCKFEQNQSVEFVEEFCEYPHQQRIVVDVLLSNAHHVEQDLIDWQYDLNDRQWQIQ